MRILIASTIVPFIEGGGTFIVDWLHKKLIEYGYDTEVLKIPFYSYHQDMPDQMLALRLMDLSDAADILITIRTPSYVIQHPKKRVWFIHHHRGVYDYWGTSYQDVPDTKEGLTYKNLIIKADNLALSECEKIYTNSKIVAKRLQMYNDIDAPVLYPPLFDVSHFYNEEYGDYIFYPSRITRHKRQDLAVEAMRFTKSNVKLIIAGHPDDPDYNARLQMTIAKYQLEDKVKLISKWFSEEEKLDMLSKALSVVYIPDNEDSYGYPSLEAFYSKKPVITCSDSGGTLELIRHNDNGFIVSPTPEALAEKYDYLYNNKLMAKQLGEQGIEAIKDLNITWDNVISSLAK